MNDSNAQWLVSHWTIRFGEIMLTMGDIQPEMHSRELPAPPSNDGLLWWEQPFDYAPEAPVWIGAPEATWTAFAQLILSAAGVESGPPSEIKSTYLEIARQSMGSLAQDLGDRLGTQVSTAGGIENEPPSSGCRFFEVQAEVTDKSVLLYLVIAHSLSEAIAAAEATPAVSPEVQTSAVPQVQEQEPAMLGSRTFELLLDVELPVSVSFGRAAIRLSDALNLITGSMIELDRGVSDPVELLVNNNVIARGEVVVVEGNYGVRITEIVSQKERLQQSRRYMLN